MPWRAPLFSSTTLPPLTPVEWAHVFTSNASKYLSLLSNNGLGETACFYDTSGTVGNTVEALGRSRLPLFTFSFASCQLFLVTNWWLSFTWSRGPWGEKMGDGRVCFLFMNLLITDGWVQWVRSKIVCKIKEYLEHVMAYFLKVGKVFEYNGILCEIVRWWWSVWSDVRLKGNSVSVH